MTQRDPFGEIDRLLDRMNRRIEGELPGSGDQSPVNVDVVDRGDEFAVTADLPGFEKDDIEVQVVGESLHLSAAHEESSEEGDDHYVRRERRHRSFSRSIDLPEPIDEEGASAEYTNGVLTVRLPKTDPASGGRSIDIG